MKRLSEAWGFFYAQNELQIQKFRTFYILLSSKPTERWKIGYKGDVQYPTVVVVRVSFRAELHPSGRTKKKQS